METLKVLASNYSGLTGMTVNSSYPMSRAYTDSESATYAQISVTTRNTTGTFDFTGFDFSEIPTNAKIISVAVKIKAMVNSTTYITSASAQCFSGTTAKGSALTAIRNTSATAREISAGTWERSELDNFKIHISATRANKLNSAYISVYGMDVTVTYEVGSDTTPPIITVGTPNKAIISDEAGYDECRCTFTADMDLSQWEARATKKGTTPARGVGLLVESGGALARGTAGTVSVVYEELTNGDGEYTITVYGCSASGIWSS